MRHKRVPAGRPTFPSQEGFTLVEVLVAVAIVAVGFTALLGLYAGSGRLQMRQQDQFIALKLAQERLEALRYLAEKKGLTALDQADFPDDQPTGTADFIRSTQIDSVNSRLREVTVRVTYASGAIELRTRILGWNK